MTGSVVVTADGTARETVGWSAAHQVIARVPLLPVCSAESPYADFLAACRDQDELEHRLLRVGRLLAAAITPLVPQAPTPTARRALLRCRRALYNGRAVRADELTELPLREAAILLKYRRLQEAATDAEQQALSRWRTARRRSLGELVARMQLLDERDGVPDLPASLTTAWQGVKERVEATGLPHEMASKPSRLEVSGWSVLWRAELKTVPLGALCSVAPVRWTRTFGEHRTGRAGTLSRPNERVSVANDRLPLEGRDSRCGAARLDPHTVCPSLVDLHWFGAQVCESAPAPDGAALADLMHRAGLVRMSLSEAAALVDSVGGLTAARLLTRDRGGSLASDRTWAATVADAVTSGRPILSAHQVPPGHQRRASGVRATARLHPATTRSGDPALRLSFWGAARMSFVARYARALHGDGTDRLAWLDTWPGLTDLDPGTGLAVDPHPGRCRTLGWRAASAQTADLGRIVVVPDPGGVHLVDPSTGHRIDPVYLGMLAVGRLPSAMGLALAVADRHRSTIDAVLAAVNAHLGRRIADSVRCGAATAIPPVWLTDHLQLSPPTWVIPLASVPEPARRPGPAGFRAFHRWAQGQSLPSGPVAVRRVESQDERCLRLDHPEGVMALLRMLGAPAGAVLVEDLSSLWTSPHETLSAGEDRYRYELAVQLDGRAAVRR